MHRQWLLTQLAHHPPANDHEAAMRLQMIRFVNEYPDCFERSLLVGHITGSAWIVNPERTRVLLTHHRKLDRWLQLGGHADGDPNVLDVALREAREESGAEAVYPVTDTIFDVDIHQIPLHHDEPAHFHYDVRYLFEMDDHMPLNISGESKELAWIDLNMVSEYTSDQSVLRMVRKTGMGKITV